MLFRAWIDTEGSIYDGFNVKVSTNGGASYSQLTGVTPRPTTFSSRAKTPGEAIRRPPIGKLFAADLSAYAGQVINVRFALRTDGSITYPGVYLDDVAILD